ncbi:DUF2842 domain-containing protein [Kordiimonas aestuarii]|uniref:DUF2842 domain-containing protein n=1 Tax=Kordiimonas aestuarii TaxID=1005925 RepID=UPI0021CEC700|nr:DUF2842 domain-containing protein [Kordiimonas aestuarii]
MNDNKPATRSLWGMLALISGLTAYAFLAAGIGSMLSESSLVIQTIYYLIAGILWIFPARKILEWMGRGHR